MKVDGKKIKENVIVAISFDTWQGRTIAEDKKRIFYCTNDKLLDFKAYQ